MAWPAEGALTAKAVEALGGGGYSGVILDEAHHLGDELAWGASDTTAPVLSSLRVKPRRAIR